MKWRENVVMKALAFIAAVAAENITASTRPIPTE